MCLAVKLRLLHALLLRATMCAAQQPLLFMLPLLPTGDAHYDALQRLSAAGSPLLLELKLSQFVRQPHKVLSSMV